MKQKKVIIIMFLFAKIIMFALYPISTCLHLILLKLPCSWELGLTPGYLNMAHNATDTSYIVNALESDDGVDELGNSGEARSQALGRRNTKELDTYLDERINIPDADNVSGHFCLIFSLLQSV